MPLYISNFCVRWQGSNIHRGGHPLFGGIALLDKVSGGNENNEKLKIVGDMKMKKWLLLCLGIMLLLTGCSIGSDSNLSEPDRPVANQIEEDPESPAAEQDQVVEDNAFPGTYTVPDGWIETDEYSASGMMFYVEEGHEDDASPDNISISVGDCPYSLDGHVSFREAIMRQLAMQIQMSGNDEGAQLSGSGSNTARGYILYTFTIEADGTITQQNYILKDYGFCLVQVISFSGTENENIFEAAQSIVDSFVWNGDSQ